MTDHMENFGCHLTENLKPRDDPALFDSRLRQRLEENFKLSKTKLDEVINKYAQRQDEDPGEEEEEDDDEEDEEEVEEDEKKFMEDMEQVEEIVLTIESNEEEEEEEKEEEEEEKGSRVSRESLSKGNKESVLSVDDSEEVDGASVDMCTGPASCESRSLCGDSVDRLCLESPETGCMPIESSSTDPGPNILEHVQAEPTVLSLENGNDKARDVENVEEESMDVSITDLPSSSTTNFQVAPPSPSCVLSSEIISSVSQSPASCLTSDDVEPVSILVPVATPIDIICLDDETNSPVKNNGHPTNGAAGHQTIGNGTLKQINWTEKQSSLALGLVKLKPPSENSLRKFAKVDVSHRKALAVRQPTVNVSAPTEAVTQSSDEEDVVEILSIPAPNSRADFRSASFGREVRSSQVVNTTQVASRLGQRNGGGDECCVMTTVEEHCVSTVITATSKDERSHGVRGQQMEMKQQTRKTMRVIGQIVHFNTDSNERRHQQTQQQQQMNRMMMQGCSRVSQLSQQHTMNRVTLHGQSNLPSSASQAKRGSRVLPSGPLQKQLDDISSQIASSIFKNQPMKSSSGDPDVIICDDASATDTAVAMTTTDRELKANQLTQTNRVTADSCKNGSYEMTGKTVARTSQGFRSLLASRLSSQDTSRAKLTSKQPPRSSNALPQLPEVIELN